MSQSTAVDGPIAVIKVGGSILTSAKAYRRAAKFVRHTLQTAPYERLVVVVSAQEGTTDRLERGARKIVREPARAALDLLWSTGEIRSVALLTLHLHKLGVAAAPLNIHEAGLTVPETENEVGRWWFAMWTRRRRAAAFLTLQLKLPARRARREPRHPRVEDGRY
jgi:aspartokinase